MEESNWSWISNGMIALAADPGVPAGSEWSWTSNGMIALYIALGLALAGVVAWLLLRKTLRTRLGVEKNLRLDPDMNDWLVIFGWTPKILYVPTMLAAVLAAVLMFLQESGWHMFAGIDPKTVGGVWFTIFFVNFLIEEYDISIKVLLLGFAAIGFFLLWLHLIGAVLPFLGLFKHLAFSISGTGYLLIAVIGFLTIGISWLRGLFRYVAITPNYINIQAGPAEAGEQIGREDYSTRVDTGDFLERVLGFGRICITFKEKGRPPVGLLVWRVDRKAEMLEKVRAKYAIDYPQQPAPPRPPQPVPPIARVEGVPPSERGHEPAPAQAGDARDTSVPPPPPPPPESGPPQAT
jgi:hypothetical protein